MNGRFGEGVGETRYVSFASTQTVRIAPYGIRKSLPNIRHVGGVKLTQRTSWPKNPRRSEATGFPPYFHTHTPGPYIPRDLVWGRLR